MVQYDIDKWIDRVNNDLEVQKALGLDVISERFNRPDLVQLKLILEDLKGVMNDRIRS